MIKRLINNLETKTPTVDLTAFFLCHLLFGRTESTHQQHRGGLVLLAGRICPSQRHAHLWGLRARAQGLPGWAHARRVLVRVLWCCRSVYRHTWSISSCPVIKMKRWKGSLTIQRIILKIKIKFGEICMDPTDAALFSHWNLTWCFSSRSPLWNRRPRSLPAGFVELFALMDNFNPHPYNTQQPCKITLGHLPTEKNKRFSLFTHLTHMLRHRVYTMLLTHFLPPHMTSSN